MLTIGNIRYNLKHSNVKQVSKDTGLAYNTLIRLMNGENKNPTLKVIQSLTDYFSIKES